MKVTLGGTTTSTDTVPVNGYLLLDVDTNSNLIVNISGSGILDAHVPVDEPPPTPPILTGEILAENRQYVLRWPSSLWPTPV